MFEAIFKFFAIIFGYIMHAFYVVLDFLGAPYLWLCIVLLAIATRFIMLPQKIKSERKTLLTPAINYDLRQLRNQYGSISKDDKERLDAYKNDTKAIFKKYKVSSGIGCLTTLLQLPVFVGLFWVIKEPFKYVPALSHLSVTERADVNNFFGLSLEALPQDFGFLGYLVPFVVLLGSLLHNLPDLISKKTYKQPPMLFLTVFQVVLVTWMSFCFPIAISIYWTINDVTNTIISYTVKKSLSNNKKIQEILANTALLVEEEANNTVINSSSAESEEAEPNGKEVAVSEESVSDSCGSEALQESV